MFSKSVEIENLIMADQKRNDDPNYRHHYGVLIANYIIILLTMAIGARVEALPILVENTYSGKVLATIL